MRHTYFLIACLLTVACGGGGSDDHEHDAGDGLAYAAETRSVVSSGVTRSFVLARPDPAPAGALPIVFVLHGDGGNGNGIRSSLPLEARATTGAVFVYPNPTGSNTFEYYTYEGRTREAVFVQDVIAALDAELDVDTARVFIVGFSGGATMANALGCRLGPGVIRGLGIHSGSLYPTMDGEGASDFAYTPSGGVSCPLPATIFVWGENDGQAGVTFAIGEGVRDNYLATQTCEGTTTDGSPSTCRVYDGCDRAVVWCPVDGLGHSLWSSADDAMWSFFDSLR